MDDRHRGVSRGTELGLQAASLAPTPIPRTNQPRGRTGVEGLVAFREGRVGEWIASFAGAASRAALMSIELADHVASLQGEWRERAGRPRAGSAASKLIALLPALPVLSAPTARAAIGVSQQQTLAALKALAEAGVIRQLSAGTYDRQYAATELFDLLAAYEEGVAGAARGATSAR